MVETFGPECVRPTQQDCRRCGCCTAELCERGRSSVLRCGGHTSPGLVQTVRGCPCSAETTRHTAAWRLAQVRVTRQAREMPLTSEADTLLRALAAGEAVQDEAGLVPSLQQRGFAQLIDLQPVITALGRTYLAARDEERAGTPVKVLDVDVKARVARVEVPAWRPEEPVTVLVDQVLNDTKLTVDELAGRWLEAEANCTAADADHLVLTRFRVSPLPPGWVPMGGGGDDE